MADSKLGTNVIDNARVGTVQADKIMFGTNEIWKYEIITTDPTITYQSKAYTTITWRYTNTDLVATHIWAKLDSDSYVDLGEVVAEGYVDKQWTGLAHNTSHNTTCYAVGVPTRYVTSNIVGPSTNITTDQYVTTNPSFVNITNITETKMRVTFKNEASYTVDLHISLNDGTDYTVSGIIAGANGYKDFTGLVANTSYTPNCYASYSDYGNSTDVNGTASNTTAWQSPTVIITDETLNSITFTVKNEGIDTQTFWYDNQTGSYDSTPTSTHANLTDLAGGVTSSAITVSTLTSDTLYYVSARDESSNTVYGGDSSYTQPITPQFITSSKTATSLYVEFKHLDSKDAVMWMMIDSSSWVEIGAVSYNGVLNHTYYGLIPNSVHDVICKVVGNSASETVTSGNITLDAVLEAPTFENTITTGDKVTFKVRNNAASEVTIYWNSGTSDSNDPTTNGFTLAGGALSGILNSTTTFATETSIYSNTRAKIGASSYSVNVSYNTTTSEAFTLSYLSDTHESTTMRIKNNLSVICTAYWTAQVGSYETPPDDYNDTIPSGAVEDKTVSGLPAETMIYVSARIYANSQYYTQQQYANETDFNVTTQPIIGDVAYNSTLSFHSWTVQNKDSATATTVWSEFDNSVPTANEVTGMALNEFTDTEQSPESTTSGYIYAQAEATNPAKTKCDWVRVYSGI